MPKKKTAKKTVKKKAVSKTHPYVHHRNRFFEEHPNARWLIGIFIIAVAVYIGVLWRNNQYHKAVAEILGAEDIIYNPNW